MYVYVENTSDVNTHISIKRYTGLFTVYKHAKVIKSDLSRKCNLLKKRLINTHIL